MEAPDLEIVILERSLANYNPKYATLTKQRMSNFCLFSLAEVQL